jgi:hypothetical protein
MVLRRLFRQQHAIWLAGLIGFGLTACQAPANKTYPYLIKVRIEGCQGGNGRLFNLYTQGLGPLDSAKLERGQFVFKGAVEHPGVYTVFCTCENKVSSSLAIYLPADSVEVAVTPGINLRPDIYQPAGLGAIGIGSYALNTRLFSTAPQQREVKAYLLTHDSIWNKFFLDLNRLKAKMNDAIGIGNKPEIDRWADSTRRVQEKFPDYLAMASAQFVKQHPRSEAALFALLDAGDTQMAQQRLRPYYQGLPDSVKASYFGQMLGKRFGASVDATP